MTPRRIAGRQGLRQYIRQLGQRAAGAALGEQCLLDCARGTHVAATVDKAGPRTRRSPPPRGLLHFLPLGRHPDVAWAGRHAYPHVTVVRQGRPEWNWTEFERGCHQVGPHDALDRSVLDGE